MLAFGRTLIYVIEIEIEIGGGGVKRNLQYADDALQPSQVMQLQAFKTTSVYWQRHTNVLGWWSM